MKSMWSLMRISAMMIAASPAFAQITNISPELAAGQPILETPEIELQVGPRFWYLWSTSGFPNPTNPAIVSTNSTNAFPMAGGTLSARLRALPDTTFVLSVLYGTSNASNDSLLVNPNPPTPSITSARTTQDIKRLDVEFLGLTSISDSPWAWIWGGRFEHNDSNTNSLQTSAFLNPLVVGGPVSIKTQATSNFYTLKGGMTGAVPISESGNLRLFGNIMVLAGVNSVSGPGQSGLPGVVGPDLSVGLQYVFSPTIVADIRYRGLVQFFVGAPTGSRDFTVQQGPMVGLTYKF
jgi:hypothetical protein